MGVGEGSKGRGGGVGTHEDIEGNERFSHSECRERWEKLALREDPTALTSGTWVDEESRYHLPIQAPHSWPAASGECLLLSASPPHNTHKTLVH